MADMNEFALYEVDRRVSSSGGVDIVSLLGSIADAAFVDEIFKKHAIDTVFHAAAYKHVPLIEANPLIGIANNVIGTWTVAEAAKSAGVERFVLISSDKAVRPTNVMGATKRWAELIVRSFDGEDRVRVKGSIFARSVSAMSSDRKARWFRCSGSRSKKAVPSP